MSASNQSQDATEDKSRLSRPDIFTRVAGSNLSRRDMVKASVAAGGLMWSAPMLLSSNTAAAQVGCCPTGSTTITVRVDLDGTVSCGTITCLDGPACDPDIEECLDNFVNVLLNVQVDILGLVSVAAIGITLQGATLSAVSAFRTSGGLLLPLNGDGCTTISNCPGLGVAVPPIVIQLDGIIAVANVPLLLGQLDHIELELCVPGTATGLCA